MILIRLFAILSGSGLVASGIGLTMVGVFAFIGVPLLIAGLGLISAGVNPSR
jgi:hypothetical protein